MKALALRLVVGFSWLATSAQPQIPPVLEPAQARPLSVGWAMADITPPRPVALIGQLYKRISTGVHDPLTATVLALESQGGDKPEQAILVSCDLLFVQREIQQRLQERVHLQLPEFDSAKLFVNATHTHTGPGLVDSTFKGLYDVSNDPGVMKASLVQLCCGASGYLPTARAVQGGGYSADKFRVGPEGGQVLVEETLREIEVLFP